MLNKIRVWWRRRQLKRIAGNLRNIDHIMIRQGLSRQERRFFWREFFRDEGVREATFKKIERILE